VIERIRASSLRARLIAALVLTTSGILIASFIALHERAGADLDGRVDDGLQQDLDEFRASPAGNATTEAQLRSESQAFIESQGYHPDSRIFAIELTDGTVVTNQAQLLEHGEEGEDESGSEGDDDEDSDRALVSGLLAGEQGLATVSSGDEGGLRVLSAPIGAGGARLGTIHIADSLTPLERAEAGLRDTILLVAVVALGVLVLAAAFIAARLAAPLRRMERFAQDVDAGAVDNRIDTHEGPAEVRSLAASFNHMLDRLQGSIERQREFVADASHELRTPLTVARGEVDLMRREGGAPDPVHLETVSRELQRMDRLVDDMLVLARADSGPRLALEPVDLDDYLEDLERELPMLGERQYLVERASGTLLADRERLTQVIRNIVRNAVAHTDAGGTIAIRVIAASDRIRFQIDDDGPGFRPGQAERLFDRFYRTDEGRGRDEGGSGLGLAIAKALVEAHGGTIAAGAAPGGGARLTFELPVRGPE